MDISEAEDYIARLSPAEVKELDKLLIESKEDMAKRGVDSPDDGDALALTFAAPVVPSYRSRPRGQVVAQSWDWS